MIEGKQVFGIKESKERITITLTVGLIGEKRKLMIIGKSKSPHSFPRFQISSNFFYSNSTNAWTTKQIFGKYLSLLNTEFKNEKRNVCIIMDNCSAHILNNTNFSNIKLFYLPANTTSIAQPLDAGFFKRKIFFIINLFELRYNRINQKKL